MHPRHEIFVREFLDASPLHAAFVVEAMRQYSKGVIKNKKLFKKHLQFTIVYADGWIECARQVNKRLR